MALKKVTILNEGPMDYLRGAAKQVAPAVRQMHQAGQTQSLVGNLDAAVKQLAALMKNVAPQTKMRTRAKPKPTAPQQPSTTAPASAPQPTFSSYIQDTVGDQLNEGPMDFLKGAASKLGSMAMDEVRKRSKGYVDVKGFLDRAVDKSAQYGADRQRQQVLKQVQIIRQLVAKFPNQAQAIKRVKALLIQLLGQGPAANASALVFPPKPRAKPAAPTPAAPTPAAPTPAAPTPAAPTPHPTRRRKRPQTP